MSQDWKIGFRRAVIDALVTQGSPIRANPSFYGWVEYDLSARRDRKRARIKSVGVDYEKTTWDESSWDEFMGTFYEGDTRVYGVDLNLVLLDGTSYRWRYSGSVSTLITEVLKS